MATCISTALEQSRPTCPAIPLEIGVPAYNWQHLKDCQLACYLACKLAIYLDGCLSSYPVRILIANQKGGTGKTRTCMLLASALRSAGKTVTLEDHDPQLSLTHWSQSLAEPFAIETTDSTGFVLIDTPPRLDLADHTAANLLTQLIQGADRVVLVAELGGLEIAAAKPMADFIRQSLAEIPENRRPRAAVLWNKIQARTKEGRQALAPLADYLGLPALRTTLPFLHAYHTVQYTGWSGVTGEARARVLDLALEIVA